MPKLSIVICHHEQKNRKYLDLALESISHQDVNKEVFVVDSSESDQPDNPIATKTIRVPHTTGSAVAMNKAAALSGEDSKYILLLNDDVILTKHCCEVMMRTQENYGPMILNAFSNCDNGYYFHLPDMKVEAPDGATLSIPQFMEFEHIAGFKNVLMNYPDSREVLLVAPFVCFYATMIPTLLWRTLKGLDEQFESGPDDKDFCFRAAKFGVKSVINLGTTIWHFGGKTIATKDQMKVAENRVKQAELFEKKWGFK